MTNRQSARAYLPKLVSRADIEDIFKYAGRAPSAINLQPWEYVIVYGEEIAEALDISDNKEIVLGIALGYADTQSFINRFKTERENLDAFRSWYE